MFKFWLKITKKVKHICDIVIGCIRVGRMLFLGVSVSC